MELANHTLEDLFEQLGLDNSDPAIDRFIAEHKPLASHIMLPDATFWSSSQAAFLRQSLAEDADWAILVDTLDSMLRK